LTWVPCDKTKPFKNGEYKIKYKGGHQRQAYYKNGQWLGDWDEGHNQHHIIFPEMWEYIS